ncbi:heterotrimeric G protein alpha subunit B [Mycena pura]|uniref:Heterotrimeric G protein alpha subunit B n=1 Tax=Mycena pura TaxID=153505 RepID=A0AAD6V1J1_9AGAR|nr:heterotrimeric G protein alpha subunit B [Mycena pura]
MSRSDVHEMAKARNDEIEIQLKRDAMKAKKEIKMLLLGPPDSGQSKVAKHLKSLHLNGYSAQEREAYKQVIFSNTIENMHLVLQAMPQLDLPLAPQNDVQLATILSVDPHIDIDVLPPSLAEAIHRLWRDPGVKEAVRRSREFQLDDDAIYFFNSIDRIAAPDYLPTDQDILRSRVKTTAITETIFEHGELTYKLFDVSHMQSDRRKWLRCFDNVEAILFLASLSGYDQMDEDECTESTRLREALTFFDSICNSSWFANTNIILLLNDADVFAEKLPRSPLVDYFPDYTGGDNYDAACDYILHRFVSRNQSAANKQIFAHYTYMSDPQQLNFVFNAMRDILLQMHLRKTGRL